MAILNKTIAILIIWFLNIDILHAQCETIFNCGVDRIDSIIQANSCNKNNKVIITNNNAIVFILLLKELYPNTDGFLPNIEYALVASKKELYRLSLFLHENNGEIVEKLNSMNQETFHTAKYSRIKCDDKQLKHAALLHFLDNSLSTDFLDFEKICNYHLENINNAPLNKQGQNTIPTGDDYVFMLTILGMTNEPYEWNYNTRYIDSYSLRMFSNWCKQHHDDKMVAELFFNNLCDYTLTFNLYSEE